MSALLALAERCEQAAGPDRELDADIHCALGDDQRRRAREALGPFGDFYTRSLDAAMNLVPEGWQFGCGSKDATCRAWAWVGSGSDPMDRADHISNAATPALALTAACLKARAAHGETL